MLEGHPWIPRVALSAGYDGGVVLIDVEEGVELWRYGGGEGLRDGCAEGLRNGGGLSGTSFMHVGGVGRVACRVIGCGNRGERGGGWFVYGGGWWLRSSGASLGALGTASLV